MIAQPDLPQGSAVNNDRLSLLAFAIWLVGAVAARSVGLWVGIGSAAILLGTMMLLTTSGAAVRQQLRPSLLRLGIGIAAGCVMIAVTQLAFPLAVQWVPQIAPSTATLYGVFGVATPLKLAVMILVILGEEIVWRGVVQSALMAKVGPRAAVVLGAIAYAGAHGPVGSPLLVVVALCCGLYWGALRAITKSLIPSLVAHVLWDLTVLVFVPVLH
jgi:membrane protease YdiL (CAAX protease family)